MNEQLQTEIVNLQTKIAHKLLTFLSKCYHKKDSDHNKCIRIVRETSDVR